MIEAELKARVRNPVYVLDRLDQKAEGRTEIYQDTYYDEPSGSLDAQDQELRLRTVRGADSTRSFLTYKDARIDSESGSKPEHETRVDNPEAVHAMLRGLGYIPAIAFQKRCRNYEFSSRGRSLLATLVQVPEIEGTFLEVETMVPGEPELPAALHDVRSVMSELGIRGDDFTTEMYTDAVAARRAVDGGATPPA
ncbi:MULTISPECIES: class IV adenylate cyclase [unclassified Streptomyces]|uniref:class IV adenylate cyclase n=1 Tax=unclassified Streptomyces TaxID=2593676 RepID=UPI00037E733E|nr:MULTISPECIES: class IV adenylate cyclase [unclassified Streptomyces]MYT31060.1 class IV adenylate cyclase [Streptomyces sp. SID8354]